MRLYVLCICLGRKYYTASILLNYIIYRIQYFHRHFIFYTCWKQTKKKKKTVYETKFVSKFYNMYNINAVEWISFHIAHRMRVLSQNDTKNSVSLFWQAWNVPKFEIETNMIKYWNIKYLKMHDELIFVLRVDKRSCTAISQ